MGYFALDLGPAGAMCLSRLFLKEKARGQGIGRSIVAYAQKLAEGDGRSRLYMRVWARDLKAEGFAKKCRFRKAETAPVEVLPGTTLDITTWEKLWRLKQNLEIHHEISAPCRPAPGQTGQRV